MSAVSLHGQRAPGTRVMLAQLATLSPPRSCGRADGRAGSAPPGCLSSPECQHLLQIPAFFVVHVNLTEKASRFLVDPKVL